MTAIVYKFLARGARGPISGYPWPTPKDGTPGAWSPEATHPMLCKTGVHACRRSDLAYWLHEELWRVELEGDVQLATEADCVVARRGRLLNRFDAWSEGGVAQAFAAAVRDRAADVVAGHEARAALTAYVEDASCHVRNGYRESPALAALCAAMAVARTGPEDEIEERFRRERAWQSAWITSALALPGDEG